MDTLPTIAATRRSSAALRPFGGWLLRLRVFSSAGVHLRNGGVVRLVAALLIALAALSGRHEGQADPTGQVKVSMTAPITSGADLLALAAGTVEVLDDGIDIHLALRGQQAVANPADASLVAKPYADTVTLTGPRLPERPPRIA